MLFSVQQLTGYAPQELIDKTLYKFIHAADAMHVRDSHMICRFAIVDLTKRKNGFKSNSHAHLNSSMVQGSSDNQILSLYDKDRRMDMDAIVCNYCAEFTFIATSLYS